MASHRRTAAAACAVILASISLYPIFTGTGWFWAGCGSALVVALTGTATRLRRLPVTVTLLAGVLALFLYLNLVFANARSLYHLLPTPGSLAALVHTAGQGFSEASRYAPPVPGLRGMVLLAAGGIGIAALLTDLIAVRLDSAALAGLPLLLLFTEPFTLSVARGFVGTTLAFCIGVAGYLALLSSEGRDRIRAWEQADDSDHYAPDTRPLAAAGRRVGTASVLLALCLPLFIPGLHMTRLFGGQPGIGGKGGSGSAAGPGFPNPTAQLSQELTSTKVSTVLTYTSKDPGYLQMYALNKLTDDAGWQLFGQPESLVPVSPRLPAAPGLTEKSGVASTRTTVTIASGVGTAVLSALPVPYPATSVTAKGTLQADRSTLMVFDTGVTPGGLTYTVTSLSESPGEQLLNVAPPPAASIASHDLSVPADYDPLRALALSVVRAAGAKTQFQEAVALQNWLAGGSFKYTVHAPTVLSAADLTRFLKVTKQGYCQQFSSAMAVLARLLGIPSRVAVGFTAGQPNVTGTYRVTTHDAHAWPELFFQGYGWLRFEPTPSGTAGQGTAYAPSYSTTPGGAGGPPPLSTATSGPGATASGLVSGLPPNIAQILGHEPGGTTAVAGGDTLSPWEIFGLVVAGLAVLALIAPWCARLAVRRLRWRRGRHLRPARPVVIGTDRTSGINGASGTGGAIGTAVALRPQVSVLSAREIRIRARDIAWAHAAWQELRDDLMDYGAGYLPSESPRAVAARAGEGLGLTGTARVALGRIAMAEERARYAPGPADGSGLRADSVAVRRAIAAAVPRRTRWRARLLPSSVLGPVLVMMASAANPYRGRIGTEGGHGLGLERLGRFRRGGS
jgi:transglutaminase-like putative cysteine protease